MKDNSITSTPLIAESYTDYHQSVYQYIYYKINSKEEAEDLSQDVFLRLMDYNQMLRPETVKHFIFTIARNLVTDYIRRYYRKQEMTSYMYDTVEHSSNETESRIIANDLLNQEKARMALLPLRRREVYVMSRFEDKSIQEISSELNLSFRTIENHLFTGRKEIREFIAQCI
ncbi:sigma-70 family RNA polymerase sigma factor [Bacteroides sp.]|uniref:sigma-70 family RNA polymerase sigma factor n=1 Tax=Bacteroides sp. TaxID=29523 RepID=UPI0026136380|nr:sigma-70 family RNA polymerase sigma factor [Bacteroides sp.]